MKKSLTLFILFSFCLIQVLIAQTVYITDTGAKYHSRNCRFIKKSKIAIDLSDAKKNYEACKVCHPSQIIAVTKTTETMPSHQSNKTNQSHNASSSQCTSQTKAGSRCKKMTKSTNGKCSVHTGK